jgi:hypothetical protein
MNGPREKGSSLAGLPHGVSRLPSVVVGSYNVELRDGDGFIGDRASKGAFRDSGRDGHRLSDVRRSADIR